MIINYEINESEQQKINKKTLKSINKGLLWLYLYELFLISGISFILFLIFIFNVDRKIYIILVVIVILVIEQFISIYYLKKIKVNLTNENFDKVFLRVELGITEIKFTNDLTMIFKYKDIKSLVIDDAFFYINAHKYQRIIIPLRTINETNLNSYINHIVTKSTNKVKIIKQTTTVSKTS